MSAHTSVFDLDKALYHQTAEISAHFNNLYHQAIADVLQKPREEVEQEIITLFEAHGDALSTLKGGRHAAEFCAEIEKRLDDWVNYSLFKEISGQRAAIEALPGRKIVFSNATRAHVERVLPQIGLNGVFERFYGIGCVGFYPKSREEGFHYIAQDAGFNLKNATFIDDSVRNLICAKQAGFGRTVMITWDNEPQIHSVEIDEYHENALQFCLSDLRQNNKRTA